MLPNANGAVVTFMALQAFARVPAMLNYAAGAQAMRAACAAARVDTVLCSRAFVERAQLEPVVAQMQAEGALRFVWLEDVRAGWGCGRSCAAGSTPAAPAGCRGRAPRRTARR